MNACQKSIKNFVTEKHLRPEQVTRRVSSSGTVKSKAQVMGV